MAPGASAVQLILVRLGRQVELLDLFEPGIDLGPGRGDRLEDRAGRRVRMVEPVDVGRDRLGLVLDLLERPLLRRSTFPPRPEFFARSSEPDRAASFWAFSSTSMTWSQPSQSLPIFA